MSWLVDADNNRYVLAHPSDSTNLPEDMSFLNDILYIIMMCFVTGVIAKHLKYVCVE